jgi:hypothetical protein
MSFTISWNHRNRIKLGLISLNTVSFSHLADQARRIQNLPDSCRHAQYFAFLLAKPAKFLSSSMLATCGDSC